VLSLFSPFSPSVLHSSPLSYVLHSSPLSFVDFLVVVGLTVGLGFGLGGLWFVRGFGFWSRRRSGLRFAPGGLGFLSRCRSGCGLISGWVWVLGLPWVLGEHSEEENRNEEREKNNNKNIILIKIKIK
jgi:hypothetical protein